MDQDIENIIKERYQALQPDVKRAIKNLPLSEITEDIIKNLDLHIDQAGDLYTETLLILLGAERIEDFEKNIKDALKIDGSAAKAVLQSVNTRVFMVIRESLKNEKLTEENPNTNNPDLNRDSILSEIENPAPTVHPISIADQTVPGPAQSREIMETPTVAIAKTSNTPTTTKESDGKSTNESATNQFIAGKMTETVNLPSQKYSVDPYREPMV